MGIKIKTLMKCILLFAFSVACNQIQSGENLSKSDIALIKKLFDLEENEQIIKFYSEYKNHVAGNFYTDKRVGSYWLDEKDISKNEINFAVYSEIEKIDTVVYAGLTFSPFLNIKKRKGTSFKVCFDGEESKLRAIFLDIIARWKKIN